MASILSFAPPRHRDQERQGGEADEHKHGDDCERAEDIHFASPAGAKRANRLIDDCRFLARIGALARFVDQAPGGRHAMAQARPSVGLAAACQNDRRAAGALGRPMEWTSGGIHASAHLVKGVSTRFARNCTLQIVC